MNKNIYVNIDTLNLSMDIENIVRRNTYNKKKDQTAAKIIDTITNRLTNKEVTNGEGFTTTSGKLKNYYVEITNSKITMFGSLCKFYHGNNLSALTLLDLKKALKMLENESGLPIYAATIVRIDVGINLVMKQPINNYLDQFDETSRWIRNQYKTQLSYTKQNQSLTFYDKKQELLKHDPSTFHLIREKNVMRIESRSLKQVRQTFKYNKPIKVAMLLSTTFREKLFLKFIKDYESITTNKKISFLNATSVADIKNITYFMGIEKVGGKKEFLKIINDVRKANNWPYSKTHTIRQWITRVIKHTPAIEEVDSIHEINELVALALTSTDLITLE